MTTLRRRMVITILVAMPLIWLITLAVSYWRVDHEINELYDTQAVRMAEQLRDILPSLVTAQTLGENNDEPPRHQGHANRGDLAINAWTNDGTPLYQGRDAVPFPSLLTRPAGFKNIWIDQRKWRVFYLDVPQYHMRIAVGQKLAERNELRWAYLGAQLGPQLLILPIFLVVMILAIQYVLRPVRALSDDIQQRSANSLIPLETTHLPAELQPIAQSVNSLMRQLEAALQNEQRLTADAAHELRTPLAALQAQWEVASKQPDGPAWEQSRDKVSFSLARMHRLIGQLLLSARMDMASRKEHGDAGPVDWHHAAELAVNNNLPLIEKRQANVEVRWPETGVHALPMVGDDEILAIMLRNLLDNALRYGPPGVQIQLTFTSESILIEDNGPGVPEPALARLGMRFFRVTGDDQTEGNGLGLSIVEKIARMHDLSVTYFNRAAGGLAVQVMRQYTGPAAV